MRIELDLSRWPLVITTPPEGTVEDDELMSYLEGYKRVLTDHPGGVFVSVLDLRRHSGLTPRQRKLLTDWMRDEMDRASCRCLGSAMIFSSGLLRGMMTAVLWLRDAHRYPRRVFATLEDAVKWGNELVRAASIEQRT